MEEPIPVSTGDARPQSQDLPSSFPMDLGFAPQLVPASREVAKQQAAPSVGTALLQEHKPLSRQGAAIRQRAVWTPKPCPKEPGHSVRCGCPSTLQASGHVLELQPGWPGARLVSAQTLQLPPCTTSGTALNLSACPHLTRMPPKNEHFPHDQPSPEAKTDA